MGQADDQAAIDPEAERQTLAVTSHESIAKVLDAGTSRTGRREPPSR